MNLEEEIKSKFNNQYHKARVNIHFTNNYISDQLSEILKPLKLSPTQFNILRILRGQYPDACSIGLLKERMLDKNSDVSRIIDRLLLKKLVKRNECEKDRRQKDIEITAAGLTVLAKIDTYNDALDKKMQHLTIEEITTLNNLLDKIRI